MKPNEWGDFFAGFVAPLAFLWLVLGYLQQGEELKASGTALEQQAQELRRSVEQQQALVEVTRQQVAAEREAATDSRRRQEEALKAKFVFKNEGGTFVGDGRSTYNLLVANGGAIATDIVATFDDSVAGTRTILEVAMLNRGQQMPTSLNTTARFPQQGAKLRLTYSDAAGRERQLVYLVQRQVPEDPQSTLRFVEVA
ncbi:MAG: hypothetical protein U1F32_07570 [Roseateles sp.]